jgi:hypothetical protein
VRCVRVEQAQLLEVSLNESTCVVSDGYHRTVAVLARDALDTFREEFPGQALSGTMVNIQKAAFEVRPEKVTPRTQPSAPASGRVRGGGIMLLETDCRAARLCSAFLRTRLRQGMPGRACTTVDLAASVAAGFRTGSQDL